MTVEHVRTVPARRPVVRTPGRTDLAPTQAPPQGRRPAPARSLTTVPTQPDQGPMCLMVPEIADGDATSLVRTLRRRESTRAVLLTRKAGRRELVVLLAGGVRGAITAEAPGAVRIATTRPAPDAPAAGPDLTARELGVLSLVADGRTNRQIGEQLTLSALTVKSHLARISRKVGTGDRAEMVAYAIRRELLT